MWGNPLTNGTGPSDTADNTAAADVSSTTASDGNAPGPIKHLRASPDALGACAAAVAISASDVGLKVPASSSGLSHVISGVFPMFKKQNETVHPGDK